MTSEPISTRSSSRPRRLRSRKRVALLGLAAVATLAISVAGGDAEVVTASGADHPTGSSAAAGTAPPPTVPPAPPTTFLLDVVHHDPTGWVPPSGEDPNDEDAPADGDPDDSPYALLRTWGWELDEAVDPPPDASFLTAARPVPAWWAEYHRSSTGGVPAGAGPVEVERIVLSGHRSTVGSCRDDLERFGFTFVPVTSLGPAAIVGTAAATDPTVLVHQLGDATVMVLSYELSPDELVALAADVVPADAAAWLAAGGVIDR